MKAIRVNSLHIRRSLPILGGLLATTLAACASFSLSPRPVLDRLAIARITIVPTSVEEADASDREWFQEILADQATAVVKQISIDEQLARRVEPEGPQAEALRLSGTLAIPTALPPEYRGSHAAFQRGALAVARMELHDSDGTLLTTVEATVHWKDVRWTRGGHKTRRARRIESSLIDATQLAMKRAVEELVSTACDKSVTTCRAGWARTVAVENLTEEPDSPSTGGRARVMNHNEHCSASQDASPAPCSLPHSRSFESDPEASRAKEDP